MTFQILSGGGFLGLYTAATLAELEEHSGNSIADHFDLIAGTSIGGNHALGLAARTPAAKIRDAFIRNGPFNRQRVNVKALVQRHPAVVGKKDSQKHRRRQKNSK